MSIKNIDHNYNALTILKQKTLLQSSGTTCIMLQITKNYNMLQKT